ncbi:hypothetical protein HK098_006556 [Nowakowskiella sp. JEL0407]|nr:hypothetical protein HK098_006556 [Nowakowskiella sp. JEL0407]
MDFTEKFEKHTEASSHSSWLSGEDTYTYDENRSSSYSTSSNISNSPILNPPPPQFIKKTKKTKKDRRMWLVLSNTLTFWAPPFVLRCCRMKSSAQRTAWREKFTLFLLIILSCAAVLFYIIGLGLLICPRQPLLSEGEVEGRVELSFPFVSAYGSFYRIDKIVSTHTGETNGLLSPLAFKMTVLGRDVSSMFARDQKTYCPGFDIPAGWDDVFERGNQGVPEVWFQHPIVDASGRPKDYLSLMRNLRRGFIARDKAWIQKLISSDDRRRIIVCWDRVYDVSTYYDPINIGPPNWDLLMSKSLASKNGTDRFFPYGFLGPLARAFFDLASVSNPNLQTPGPTNQSLNNIIEVTDSTALFEKIRTNTTLGGAEYWDKVRKCMDGLFFVGVVDHRNDMKCKVSNYMLLLASAVIMLVIVVKFTAALRFGSIREPENHKKFVICQVPCYTEGRSSLLKTFISLAKLMYDDRYKLLFIVCDGLVVGEGNDKPTVQIVLEILGVNYLGIQHPTPAQYEALGPNNQQFNRANVYSGLFEVDGHFVPFIVVAKVGREDERIKPGNRGKRDSQLLLLRFLSRVHLNEKLTELECHLMHHMKNIIGVPPQWYEYVLMVDADTQTYPESLNRLVSCMIMGICGETQLSNDKDSWVTMIQVYEYFVSHHMSKAFESLFGTVTCLPGCFSLYRLRSAITKRNDNSEEQPKFLPILIAPEILEEYSTNVVDTLHLKNLLSLGEDRFLTTLLLKYFPKMKTKFTPDAKALTTAPDTWSVLLSQRRRWINSTVHNLAELLNLKVWGCSCCISMRFIVLVDLVATITQPAVLLYVLYLIYTTISGYVQDDISEATFPLISVAMIATIYGLQIILFLLKADWQQIGWMVISLIATPIFSFYIPLYAFWNFDDFSWGSTRQLSGQNGKEQSEEDFDKNETEMIMYRFDYAEYEKTLAKKLGKKPKELPPKNLKNVEEFYEWFSRNDGYVNSGSSVYYGNVASESSFGYENPFEIPYAASITYPPPVFSPYYGDNIIIDHFDDPPFDEQRESVSDYI